MFVEGDVCAFVANPDNPSQYGLVDPQGTFIEQGSCADATFLFDVQVCQCIRPRK